MPERNHQPGGVFMKERKEILDYGLTLPDVYMDAPFHDDNWICVDL